ncbi:carboxypeptidase regulatory-like domain-containing protein [Subtercola boreus]|nr:carboxypeptidase regulatory-like domain-containing protein [Subtercola boreus]TQL55840.1 carboxypeptidase family protein [Subtercola boreus]
MIGAALATVAMLGSLLVTAESASASDFGTVTGIVHDGSASGAPVAGIRVYAYNSGEESGASGTSGSDGRFTITGVAAGSAYLEVEQQPPYLAVYGIPVTVVPGAPATKDVVIQRSASIFGTVTGDPPDAGPLAGATVNLDNDVSLKTGSDGTFSIPNRSLGDHTVVVSATGYNSRRLTTTLAAGAQWDASVTLTRLSTVTGTVTAQDTGQPLENVAVTLGSLRATTGAAGQYSLRNVPAGSQTLRASDLTGSYVLKAGTVTVVGSTPATLDFTLTPEPTGRVSGRVVMAGPAATPAVAVGVYFYRAGLTPASTTSVSRGTLDADGNYTAVHLPDGDYVALFADDCGECEYERMLTEWWDNSFVRKTSTIIHIVGGQAVTGVDAVLDDPRALQTVSGTVTLPGSTRSTARTLVELLLPDGSVAASATTSSTGSYSVKSVRSASYRVRFSNSEYRVAYYNSAATFESAAVVPVNGPVTGIDATLTRLPPFTSTGTPTISGRAVLQATLTASPGSWSPTATTFTYQWKSDYQVIPGATKSTFTPTLAEQGHRLNVAVTASAPGILPTTRTSAQTGPVLQDFYTPPVPTISGTVVVGSTLTARHGPWRPAASPTFTYKWKRDGAVISGATSTMYKLVVADMGKRITVDITGSAPNFVTITRSSAATTKVVRNFTATAIPTIVGSPIVGRTLTAKAGTWTPSPVSFRFTWLRNGVAIPGATASSYALTKADSGARISVTVKGIKTDYVTTSRTSLQTKPVT